MGEGGSFVSEIGVAAAGPFGERSLPSQVTSPSRVTVAGTALRAVPAGAGSSAIRTCENFLRGEQGVKEEVFRIALICLGNGAANMTSNFD